VIEAVIFDWGGTLTPWKTIDNLAGWRLLADVLHAGDTERAAVLADALLAAEDARWATARDPRLRVDELPLLSPADQSGRANRESGTGEACAPPSGDSGTFDPTCPVDPPLEDNEPIPSGKSRKSAKNRRARRLLTNWAK
jgi:hypothetical protein